MCLDDQKTHMRHTQLPPEFPVCLKAEARNIESGVENTTGLSGKEKEKSICASMNNKAKSSLHSPQGKLTLFLYSITNSSSCVILHKTR